MKLKTLAGVVLGSLLASSCAMTRHARLYELQSADVLTATYRYSGSGRGAIWIGESEATASCKGEYVTVPEGDSGWGLIFAGGHVATVSTTTVQSDQRGRAVVACHDARTIECEYVTSALTAAGHGACQDNQGHTYRLMF